MIDLTNLNISLVAAGLPVIGVALESVVRDTASGIVTWYSRVEGQVRVDWSAQPTGGQDASAASIVAAATVTKRKPRTMYAIANDIFTLTTGAFNPSATLQKLAIITDLFTGNLATGSQKWQQDTGPNAAAMSAVYAAVTPPSAISVFNPAQQLIMAAMYVQDNPLYLVHPAFDSTINIPGDQAG